MTEFGNNTRQLLEMEYRDRGSFSEFQITNNDISNARWNNLTLSHVLFEKNNMQQMSMENGSHYRTDFMMSDLRYSDFSHSFFEKVTFNQCSLIKANLSGSHLHECLIDHCSAESLDIRNCRIVKTRFRMSELYKLDCKDSVVMNSEFIVDMNRNFWGLQKAAFDNSIMMNCLFRGVEYNPESFSGALFVNCRFEN